jgi:SPP1 gp7 family putative phage head morphogenesis protein
MKKKSFSIAGVENQEFLNAIQSKLEEALRTGQSYKDWAAGVREVIDSMGYSGEQPFRLNTIYRTNLFSSYTMGQMEQVNEVKDRFPYWRYVAILDARTRPEHRALNGQIFPQGEGPIPPIDYNCRCSMQFIHVDELAQSMIQPLRGEALDKFMQELNNKTQVLRLDQKEAFDKWLKDKEGGMNTAIKNAMAEVMN